MVDHLEMLSETGRGQPPPRGGLPAAAAAIWRHQTAVIAVFAAAAIAVHLVLRFGLRSTPAVSDAPLLATIVLGGVPLLFQLLRDLLRREFGSDLLGGISIVTSVLLGEYLAGSIVVLMLSGGEALETLRAAQRLLGAGRAGQADALDRPPHGGRARSSTWRSTKSRWATRWSSTRTRSARSTAR